MTIDFLARWVIKSISASGDFLFTYVFIASEQVTLRGEGDLLALVEVRAAKRRSYSLLLSRAAFVVSHAHQNERREFLSRSLVLFH